MISFLYLCFAIQFPSAILTEAYQHGIAAVESESMFLQKMLLDAVHEFAVEMDDFAAFSAVQMEVMRTVMSGPEILVVLLFLIIQAVPPDPARLLKTVQIPVDRRLVDGEAVRPHLPQKV